MIEQDRSPRSRPVARILAGSVVVSLGLGSTLLFGASPASAAAPQAQAVGRFLDGATGGKPLQQIVDVKDARATSPGTTSAQNPLDVRLFGQADIPLSGKLQLPGNNVFHTGAANQIAIAKPNGYALGAAGAVANQGGAAIGGQSGTYPSGATINLSGASAPSGLPALPGGKGANALGGLSATIGAVTAIASTPVGYGNAGGRTHYSIAGLQLHLASPALGGVLKQLADALDQPSPVPANPLPIPHEPKACKFKGQVLTPISIDHGAVAIDPSSGAITIDVAALLRNAGANLNFLPPNTDLLGYVTNYLANGFSKGLQNALVNSFAGQKQNFADCISAIGKSFPGQLKPIVQKFMDAVTTAQTQLTGALDMVTSKLGGGTNPFAPLVTGLSKALQLGVNVQPNGPRGSYRSPLHATPDQATPVVAGQTIVRAIEVDLGGGQGASIALANAAAGPGSPPPAPAPTTRTAQVKHDHVLPTGVPAGQGPIGGATSQLPLVLLAIGAALAAAASVVWRRRPRGH